MFLKIKRNTLKDGSQTVSVSIVQNSRCKTSGRTKQTFIAHIGTLPIEVLAAPVGRMMFQSKLNRAMDAAMLSSVCRAQIRESAKRKINLVNLRELSLRP